MDGTLAAIYYLTALIDMGTNYCPNDGCLASNEAQERFWVQAGAVEFQREIIGEEVYFGYDLGRARGPFQRAIGFSITDAGSFWIGTGNKTQWELGGGWFFEGSSMPGLYIAGDGEDLGGYLQFRSALGIGYEFDNGGTLSLHYDHRSNADIEDYNPGLETIGIRYAFVIE